VNRDENILWYDFGKGTENSIIYPLADVHLGAEGSEIQAFAELVKQIASEPNSYVTLQGDLIDNGTRNSVTNIFRATMSPSQQKKEMAATLAPIRDKILCIMPGNHERRSGKDADDDPAYDIAVKLDIEDKFRESIAFLRIGIGERRISDKIRKADYKPYTYYIACVHGAGGGNLPGAGINRADRMSQALDGIDIFIHGHTHRPYAIRGSKIIIDYQNKRAIQRPTLTMCAGQWLQYVGYPIDKMMNPVAMPGANKLSLSGVKYRFEAIV
jgi:predicted phosphodiesterase